MKTLAAIILLLALPGVAEAASPLRPPSLNERNAILRWADRHETSGVNRICVHRARPRYAVVRLAHVTRARRTVLLRRRDGRWRRSDGGGVRRELLTRSCCLLYTSPSPRDRS